MTLMCGDVVWSGDIFCFVSAQGDRGFDGLPGLPGEKGHRVSTVWSLSSLQFAQNSLLVLCEICPLRATMNQILKEYSRFA